MATKKTKPKVKARKPAVAAKKPAFVCEVCGLEVAVVNGVAEASTLVCCDQAMKSKK
jgi:hypothetical protein